MSDKPTYKELELRVKELEENALEFKQIKKNLIDSEEKFRLLYERAPLGYQSLDENGHVLEVNKAWLDTLGYTRDEVIGKSFGDFLNTEWKDHFKKNFPRFKAVGEILGIEFDMVKKDGSTILVAFNGKIGKQPDGSFEQTHCILHDITEQKRTEEALIASEEKYRSLFENANDAIFIIDPVNLTILDANENAINRLGYSREELHWLTVNDITGPSSVSSNEKRVRELMQKGSSIFEHTQKHKDGREIPVEISSKVINYHGSKVIQAFVRDITERKQNQERLRKGSEIIQHFAYSVAHDLKNPSVSIYGLAKRLNNNFGDRLNEKGRSYCEQIQKSSEQIAALAETINVYIATKERPLSLEEVNPKEILQIICEEFSVQFNLRHIKMSEPDDIPAIKADKLSMLRVFRNFVDNALKYGGDTLNKIEIGYKDVGDAHIFSVCDDGIGLKKEESKGVFGLFKRRETSRGVEGTGLGLAIVKEIAERHQGEVWIDPGSKKGITFYISISKYL